MYPLARITAMLPSGATAQSSLGTIRGRLILTFPPDRVMVASVRQTVATVSEEDVDRSYRVMEAESAGPCPNPPIPWW